MALAYCSLLSEELSKALHTTVNFDSSPEVGCSLWKDKQWMNRPKPLLCAAAAVGSSRNYVLCCSCLNIAKHHFPTQKCVMGDSIPGKCINCSGSDFPKPPVNTWPPWTSGDCSHPKGCSAGWCWPLPRTRGSHTPSPQLHFSCCSLGQSGTTGLWWGQTFQLS